MKLHLEKHYAAAALFLLGTEILIAVYMHDNFIRPYFGDYLVVILMYCSIKAIVNTPVIPTAAAVLLIAYLVETMQYFNLLYHLGLQHSQIANVIIGNSFAWTDMLAYTLGVFTMVGIEHLRNTNTINEIHTA